MSVTVRVSISMNVRPHERGYHLLVIVSVIVNVGPNAQQMKSYGFARERRGLRTRTLIREN